MIHLPLQSEQEPEGGREGAVFAQNSWLLAGQVEELPSSPLTGNDEILWKNFLWSLKGNHYDTFKARLDEAMLVREFKNNKTSLTEKMFKTSTIGQSNRQINPSIPYRYRYLNFYYNPAQLAIIFKRKDWLKVVYQHMEGKEFAREVLNLQTSPQRPT